MKKMIAIIALLFTLLLIFSCMKENEGKISLQNEISQEMNAELTKYGLEKNTLHVGMRYLFRYEWAQPAKDISVWIEEYRNGALAKKTIEIYSSDNVGKKGLIALFIDESSEPKGTLLLSNEGVTKSSAFLRNNILDISYNELKNISAIKTENLTTVESRRDISLLLIIQGNDATIKNTAPTVLTPEFEYEQLIEKSNYALILKCKFS